MALGEHDLRLLSTLWKKNLCILLGGASQRRYYSVVALGEHDLRLLSTLWKKTYAFYSAVQVNDDTIP